MTSPYISVIIPVYNAETTIERCVGSIVATSANIEILCVDDGSKDNSWSKLEILSQKNPKLHIIHQENAGAGKAREKGLSEAKGEFIMFCDADDCYTPETIDYIVEDIQQFNPDYIAFHRKTIQRNGNECVWGEGENVRLLDITWVDYLNSYMLNRQHGMVVTTKVFRKSIIDKFCINFGSFLFCEDMWFNLHYIMHTESFVEDYRAYYVQYQTPGSICLKPYKNYFDLNMECINAFASTHPAEFLRIQDFVNHYKFGILTWSVSRIVQGIDADSFKDKYKMCNNLFRREDIKLIAQFYLTQSNLTQKQEKDINDILNRNIVNYIWRNNYLTKIKAKIIKVIRK